MHISYSADHICAALLALIPAVHWTKVRLFPLLFSYWSFLRSKRNLKPGLVQQIYKNEARDCMSMENFQSLIEKTKLDF